MADDPKYTEKTNEELADLPEEIEAEKKANEMSPEDKQVEWSVAKIAIIIVIAVVIVMAVAAAF